MRPAVEGPNAEEWFEAMADEKTSIIENNTWISHDRPHEEKVIGSRIVL